MIDLLILTSCIRPEKQSFLRLQDPDARYKQTIDCLKYYIENTDIKNVVICDGSGYDLTNDPIANYAGSHNVCFEALFFKQNSEKVNLLGKGYGEGEIMLYIKNNSVLFKRCKTFVKVTGRLIVKNIDVISHAIDAENNTYFNIIPSLYLGCVDTRVYAMSKDSYISYFGEAYKKVDERKRQSYEFCFTDVINTNKIKILPFPYVPIIAGYSGTQNMKYKKDFIYYTSKIMTALGIMNSKFAAVVLLIIHSPIAILEFIKNKGKR